MKCGYTERINGDEIWIFFDRTQGKVILNKKREVIKIDIKV